MRFRDLFLKRRRQPREVIVPDFYAEIGEPTATMPAPPSYRPHGIDTAETLAAIYARAQADAETAHTSAETQAWGEWDQPGTGLADAPARELAPPPPMPFSGVSRIMVDRITYPDPADLSIDKDRHYRETFRLTGVATGTSGSLEDTGMWALPALEPGDGTGTRL